MQKPTLSFAALVALAVSLLHAAPARAELPLRTWVSSTGTSSTCSHAAPCGNFQTAHDNTAAGGEIGIIDSSDYGPLTITKAISIVAEGVEAGILSSTTAIDVQAGANDVVILRGLTIDGAGSGSFGILYKGGATLHVDKCIIRNFNAVGGNLGFGIVLNPATASPAEVYVSDTVIVHNGSTIDGGGIIVAPDAPAPVRVVLDRVQAHANFRGFKADGGFFGGSGSVMNINIRDSVASGNTNNGIVATTPAGGGTILMTLDHVTSANNGDAAATVGVVSDGPSSFIRLNNSVVTGNWKGLSFSNGATLESFGNNVVRGNAVDGSPSVTVGLK